MNEVNKHPLTLDEAIQHCLDVAEKNETTARRIGQQYEGTLLDRDAKECRRCAADHRQLAEWLIDYKYIKDQVSKLNNLGAAFNIIRERDD